MSIVKMGKRSDDPYARIRNKTLNDPRLSDQALGLLCRLLSKPADWKIHVKNLEKKGKNGRDAIYAALKELKECGYAEHVEVRENGRIASYDWVINDESESAPKDEIPASGFPVSGATGYGSAAYGSTGYGEPVHIETKDATNKRNLKTKEEQSDSGSFFSSSASGGSNSSGFADLVEIENQTSKPKPPEANMERSSAAAAPAAVEFTELSEIKSAVETALWVGFDGTTRNPAPFLRMVATHDHIDAEKIIDEFAYWWSENSGHQILEAPEGFKSEKDGEWKINPKTKRSQPPSEEAKEYLKWVRHVCNSFKKNFVNQVARAEKKEEDAQKKTHETAFKKSSQNALLDIIGDALSVHFEGNEKAKNALKAKAAICKNDETLAAFIKNALYSFSATMISEKKDSDFWASVDRFGMDFKDGGNPPATDGQIVSTIKKCFFVQSTKKKISPSGWASSVSVEEKTGFDFSPYSKIFASLSAVLGVTIK